MKYLAPLAIFLALVACSSAINVPDLIIGKNKVDFCIYDDYLSGLASKLSETGKVYYRKAYQALINEMGNQAKIIFGDLLINEKENIATLRKYEDAKTLSGFEQLAGSIQAAQDVTLCKIQTTLTKYVADNFKTTQGVNALQAIFTHLLTDLMNKIPEVIAAVNTQMAGQFVNIPASDASVFAKIVEAFGLKL